MLFPPISGSAAAICLPGHSRNLGVTGRGSAPEHQSDAQCGTALLSSSAPPAPFTALGDSSHRYTFHQNSSIKIEVKDTTVTHKPQTPPTSPRVPAVFSHYTAINLINTNIRDCIKKD